MERPFAITPDAGSSIANKTGAWRTARPVYVDRLPPCNDACPAGENVQAWLYHAEGGDYATAWRALVDDNPLPAVLGRVCERPCERACHRGGLDEAVDIASVERFLGDEAIARGWTLARPREESGKRVLVVGAGPAGLSAACHLRRRGHRVVVADAAPAAGGALRTGIPSSRLPDPVLDAEVAKIVELGVELTLGHEVARVGDAMREGAFDAAFLAAGANADASLRDTVADVASRDGRLDVTATMMTRQAAVFAGGDLVSAERSVAVAVGHGKRAARHIDAFLRGGTYAPAPRHERVGFGQLNLSYYGDAPAAERAMLDPIRHSAAERAALDASNALLEARRCLSCGNCFECDNCFGLCPDNAVHKRGPGKRYEFNYDYCKGCGICASECPCGAIRMETETI